MCIYLLFYFQASRGPAFFKKIVLAGLTMLCYVLYELHFLFLLVVLLHVRQVTIYMGVTLLCFLQEIFDGLCVGRAIHEDVIQFKPRTEGNNAFWPRVFKT